MRIFIAGGTGVLGRRIVPRLLEAGHDITVLARTPARAEPLRQRGAHVVGGDVLDSARTAAVMAAAAPDLVMHQLTDLAGGSLATNAQLRITGTRHLVEASLAAGVDRFIVQSIAWCYEPGGEPADETTPLDTQSPDAARRTTVDAVIAMEQQARRVGSCVILRNGMLYGPDTWYRHDGAMATAARAGKLFAGPDITSFVHVDDAAAAAVCALGWPDAAVNVVDDDPAPAHEWVPAFCAAVGAPAPPAKVERQPWARGASNRYVRELGWAPHWASWRNGFASIVE